MDFFADRVNSYNNFLLFNVSIEAWLKHRAFSIVLCKFCIIVEYSLLNERSIKNCIRLKLL